MLPVRYSASPVALRDKRALSRRDVLRMLVAAPMALGLASTAGLATLSAEVVLIVVAIVALALQVYKMFSAQGPSINDFLRMQTEMLRIISLQLATIQKGIEEILARLDELEELVGAVPSRTVIEFHRTTIAAMRIVYNEKIGAYALDLRDSGPAFARDRHSADIRSRIVNPLSQAKASLMVAATDSPAYLLVPSVATALHIEVQARSIAGDRINDIQPVLDEYRSWFERSLRGSTPSIESEMSRLRKARPGLLAKIPTGSIFSDRCFRDHLMKEEEVVVRRGGRDSDEIRSRRWYQQALIRASRFKYASRHMTVAELTTLMPSAPPEFRDGVQLLFDAKLLSSSDLPLMISADGPTSDVYVEFNQRDRPEDPARSGNPDLVPTSAINKDFIPSIRACSAHDIEPAPSVADTGKRLKAAEHLGQTHPIDAMLSDVVSSENALRNNSLSLLSHAGLHKATTSALAAIDRFELDMEQLK